VPSITLDPSSESARAVPGQVLHSADPKLVSAPSTAAPRKTVPSTPSSTLGAAPAPKVLRIKKD
jgi:hypothetical protein